MTDFTSSGILTTASDLLFTGGREGYFMALDARNGQLLWRAPVAASYRPAHDLFGINGRQYIAISAGNSLFVYTLRQ